MVTRWVLTGSGATAASLVPHREQRLAPAVGDRQAAVLAEVLDQGPANELRTCLRPAVRRSRMVPDETGQNESNVEHHAAHHTRADQQLGQLQRIAVARSWASADISADACGAAATSAIKCYWRVGTGRI